MNLSLTERIEEILEACEVTGKEDLKGMAIGTGARILLGDERISTIYHSLSDTVGQNKLGEFLNTMGNIANANSEMSILTNPDIVYALTEFMTTVPYATLGGLMGLTYGVIKYLSQEK